MAPRNSPSVLLLPLLLLLAICCSPSLAANTSAVPVNVGLILDFESLVGKIGSSCISVALEVFYATQNHTKQLILHNGSSEKDVIGATFTAIGLLKNVGVEAIIGPQTSGVADFISKLGDRTHVPIISFSATSPSLSSSSNSFFISTADIDSFQVGAIVAIIKAYGWRKVVPIYENSNFGMGVIPFLTDALQKIGVGVPYRTLIPPSANDSFINGELDRLASNCTRVFVVHLPSALGARLFLNAEKKGMMSKDYVWIITNSLGNLLGAMNSSVIASMRGVIGVKTYVPSSKPLKDFTERWRRRFLAQNPDQMGTPPELNRYDAVVGDTTIIANRSKYVDFTLPYTESGVSMIVPVEPSKKNGWVFLRPMTLQLWLATFASFIFTGVVVWALERWNGESGFEGPPTEQVGLVFYFIFSTMVFAHNQRLASNLSRLVIVVWVFAVLILTTSYTASLTSMLTVQQLQPSVADIQTLIRNRDYIGYRNSSFVGQLLMRLGVPASKIRPYTKPEDFVEALSKGSGHGGVAAIFDEIPYNRKFLGQYGDKFITVGPTYKTGGLAFAFPRGSPLVLDVSRAILNVTEGEEMIDIEKRWISNRTTDGVDSTSGPSSGSLSLLNFWGLFLITGIASAGALLFYVLWVLSEYYKKNEDPSSPEHEQKHLWRTVLDIIRHFDEKDFKSLTFRHMVRNEDPGITDIQSYRQSPVSNEAGPATHHQDDDTSSTEQGASTREHSPPDHEIVREN